MIFSTRTDFAIRLPIETKLPGLEKRIGAEDIEVSRLISIAKDTGGNRTRLHLSMCSST